VCLEAKNGFQAQNEERKTPAKRAKNGEKSDPMEKRSGDQGFSAGLFSPEGSFSGNSGLFTTGCLGFFRPATKPEL